MRRWIVLGFGLAGLAATPAQAEDDVFGYTYAAETLPKGETEMELWATDRRGKNTGDYHAQDYKSSWSTASPTASPFRLMPISPATTFAGSNPNFSASTAAS